MSNAAQPLSCGPERLSLAQTIAAMPIATDYGANRYETDDEIVLTVHRDGRTFDLRFPKKLPVPEDEQTCGECLHSRKFHVPNCSCGCPGFEEQGAWKSRQGEPYGTVTGGR